MVQYTGTLVDEPTFGREDITSGGPNFSSIVNPQDDTQSVTYPIDITTPEVPSVGPGLPEVTIRRPDIGDRLIGAGKDAVNMNTIVGALDLFNTYAINSGFLKAALPAISIALALKQGVGWVWDFFTGGGKEEADQSEFSWERESPGSPYGRTTGTQNIAPTTGPMKMTTEDMLFNWPGRSADPAGGPPGEPIGPWGPLGDITGMWAYPPGGDPSRGAGFNVAAAAATPGGSRDTTGIGAGTYDGDPGDGGLGAAYDAGDWGSYDIGWAGGGLASLSRNRGSSLRPGQESGILRTSFQEGGPAYTEGGPAYTGTLVDDRMDTAPAFFDAEFTQAEIDAISKMSDDEKYDFDLAMDITNRAAVEARGITEGKRLGEGTPYFFGPGSRGAEKGLDYSEQALRNFEWTQDEIDTLAGVTGGAGPWGPLGDPSEMNKLDRGKFKKTVDDFIYRQGFLPPELREEYPRGNTRKDLNAFERMLEGPPKLTPLLRSYGLTTEDILFNWPDGRLPGPPGIPSLVYARPPNVSPLGLPGAPQPFSPFESGLDPSGSGTYTTGGGDVSYEGFSSPEAAESYGSYDTPSGWGPAFQEGGLASLYPKPNRGSSLQPGQESGILRQ